MSAGDTVFGAELWRADMNNQLLEDLTPAGLTGQVTTNIHAAIKSVANFTLRETIEVEPYQDVLAPFLRIQRGSGQVERTQLGLFMASPPTRMHTPAHSTQTLEGKDLTWRLADDSYDVPITIAQGANFIAQLKTLLNATGLRYRIPDGTAVASSAISYPPTLTKLEIYNKILQAAGYYTLWADRQGVLLSIPYFTLAAVEPSLFLYSGEGSPVVATIPEEGVYESVANRVVVYKEDTQNTPLIAIRVNSDPFSPISTINKGRIINRIVTDSTLADQAAVDALADRLIEESASQTRKVRVTTLPMPARALHETVECAIYNDHDVPVAFGRYWCDGYTVNMGVDNPTMTFNLSRIEAAGLA